MTDHCRINLSPLTGSERVPGYSDKGLLALFGSTRVEPHLDYSLAEFHRGIAGTIKGLSISGVQAKQSLMLKEGRLTPVAQKGRFILKPSPEGYAHAAENEHACMLASRAAGIETADCGLVTFSSGEYGYLIRRFDRLKDGEALVQEELASIADLPSSAKYDTSYEALGKAADAASGGRKFVVQDYLNRVMFAYLVGNDDLHAKNFSMIRVEEGEGGPEYFRLSPNYDCLFVSSFEGEGSGTFLALDLLEDGSTPAFGRYECPTGHSFVELGRRLGLPERAVQRLYTQLLAAKPAIEKIIECSFMPRKMKQKALQTVDERLGALSKGLG